MRQSSISPKLEDQVLDTSCPSANDIQDLIMSSDSEATFTCPLPPHVAARFYRPTNSRRKSSAASSRRNSLSSLHSNRSNRSNRSAHGGPQSAHIAQHLRRASIIESRRARLADKAAHAEKVRLRAALAKAAPRMSTISEDRALAAQQARERYLAQVAASCAEEVKRAKKVAEDMKERKAIENTKLRDDMEERFAEAERRRLLYQRNLRRHRTTSLPVVEEKKVTVKAWKPKNDEVAARVLQRAWRRSTRRRAVAEFAQLDLTIEHVQQNSFEDVSSLLGQEKVLSSTAKILKLCNIPDGQSNESGESAVVRIFLSAFLVLGHPAQVFSHDGEQERDLINKARTLLLGFERLFSKQSSQSHFPASSTHLASFIEMFFTFQTAFAAWRNHDSSFLIETMIAQFVELDAIWQTVKNDTRGMVADDYKEGIQSNQTMLLVRLKRLAGPKRALQMINEALKIRRKSKTRKRSTGDIRPRSTSDSTHIVLKPVAADPIQVTSQQTLPGTFGQSQTTNELNDVISPLPNNRTIAHELAINRDYRIDYERSEIRNRINRTVFATMRRDIGAGIGDRWIVSMAATIRDTLLRVVAPGKSLHVLISETLDPGMIETQLKVGSFSYDKFFSFMNTILPKLSAPVRDPEIKALVEDRSDDFIERLAKVMHIIDLLSLDYANYLLQSSATQLIERAAAYENKAFSEQVGNRKLSKALRWWTQARSKLISDGSRRAAEGAVPSSQPSSDKIYSQGLVELFISIPPLQHIDVPETLELDIDRITRTKVDVLRIITISSILLTAKNLLKRDVRSQWKSEAQRLWDLSTSYDDSSSYLSVIESSHALPSSTRSQLSGTIDRVLSDARASPDISHPVMKVLLQKLRTHAFGRLSAASAEDRLRSTTTASEVLTQGGMAEFIGRVGAMVGEMGRVKAVDWEAHGVWLDEVAKEVAGSR
ncbi:hypothetical protein MMC14_006391 [Varicellaria rhodocarpa]|nr:hypothetical protein [Varicellaria rhodocarpa]